MVASLSCPAFDSSFHYNANYLTEQANAQMYHLHFLEVRALSPSVLSLQVVNQVRKSCSWFMVQLEQEKSQIRWAEIFCLL